MSYNHSNDSGTVSKKPPRNASALEQRWGRTIAGSTKIAGRGTLFVHDRLSDIEFFYDPFTRFAQVGMGGEWWNSDLKLGLNVINHRKGAGDPGYQPVIVDVGMSGGSVLTFHVGGGFGQAAVFTLTLASK